MLLHYRILTWHIKVDAITRLQSEFRQTLQMTIELCVDLEILQLPLRGKVTFSSVRIVNFNRFRCGNLRRLDGSQNGFVERYPEVLTARPRDSHWGM